MDKARLVYDVLLRRDVGGYEMGWEEARELVRRQPLRGRVRVTQRPGGRALLMLMWKLRRDVGY
jgi:hypothetical protein